MAALTAGVNDQGRSEPDLSGFEYGPRLTPDPRASAILPSMAEPTTQMTVMPGGPGASGNGGRLRAGMRVRVTQQIPQRDEVWTTTAMGTVVQMEQAPTGSWYAHSKGDKLWLDRLTLRADDGEIVELILDPYSKIDIIG